MSAERNLEKIKIGSLWERTDSTGRKFYAGRFGQARMLVFERRDRSGDDPAYDVFLVQDDSRGGN